MFSLEDADRVGNAAEPMPTQVPQSAMIRQSIPHRLSRVVLEADLPPVDG